MAYTPQYFDVKHIYCAREYRGMAKLEAERLARLPDPAEQRHGLIIPVVFRGADRLPPEISRRRQFEPFDSFQLSDPAMPMHPKFEPRVREIAEYITGRCDAFEALADDLCCDCDRFALPAEDEVRPWVESLRTRSLPFPRV